MTPSGHRIRIELAEVVKLLEAAVEIAHGLVTVCEHAYDHDGRSKGALAAANTFACALDDELAAAVKRADQLR
jgi:hypothetical protein